MGNDTRPHIKEWLQYEVGEEAVSSTTIPAVALCHASVCAKQLGGGETAILVCGRAMAVSLKSLRSILVLAAIIPLLPVPWVVLG